MSKSEEEYEFIFILIVFSFLISHEGEFLSDFLSLSSNFLSSLYILFSLIFLALTHCFFFLLFFFLFVFVGYKNIPFVLFFFELLSSPKIFSIFFISSVSSFLFSILSSFISSSSFSCKLESLSLLYSILICFKSSITSLFLISILIFSFFL